MTEVEVLEWINKLLYPEHLSPIQSLIVRQVWQGRGYELIAEEHGYNHEYVKGAAAKLWLRLSERLGERVRKHSFRAVIERQVRASPGSPRQVDWGEAPQLPWFYGRQEELTCLQNWLEEDGIRVIGITGLGGMGKTFLGVRLAELWQQGGRGLIWRSLAGHPSIGELLASLGVVSGGATVWAQISAWVGILSQQPLLLVLDQWEAVLEDPDYELLLQRLATERHQGRVILISRREPAGLAHLLKQGARSLLLGGLDEMSWQALCCHAHACQGSQVSWQEFHRRYSGHPLAGLLLSQIVEQFFAGDLAAFLYHDLVLLQPLRDLIQASLETLSAPDLALLQGLVLAEEGLTLAQILERVWIPWQHPSLWEMVRSLQRGCLVENVRDTWSVLPMVRAVVQEQVLTALAAEWEQLRFHLWTVHCLPDPLLPRLQSRLLPASDWGSRWQAWLHLWREQGRGQSGFGSRNLLHWGYALGVDITGADFSGLHFWQARWQQAVGVNLQGCHFQECQWLLPWGELRGLACSPDGTWLALGNGDQDQIRLWAWPTLDQELTLAGHPGGVIWLTFAGAGHVLISYGQDQILRGWDWRQGKLRWQHWVGSLKHWDLANLATQTDTGDWLTWDPETGQHHPIPAPEGVPHPQYPGIRAHHQSSQIEIEGRWQWRGLHAPLRSLSFAGEWLLAAWDNGIMRLWNWQTGYCRQEWTGGSLVALTPDPQRQQWITYSHDRGICIWDPQFDQPVQVHPVARSGHLGILAVSDPHLLVTTQGTNLCLWSQGSPKLLPLAQSLICASSTTAQGWLVGTETGTLHWGQGSAPLKHWQGHQEKILSLALGRDWAASSAQGGIVRLWHLPHGTWLADLPHPHPVTAMTVDPQQRYLLTGDYHGHIQIWDPHTGQCHTQGSLGTETIHSLAWGQDWIAAALSNNRLVIWDPQRHCIQVQTPTPRRIRCLTPIPQALASGDNTGHVQTWDPHTGHLLTTYPSPHQGWIESLFLTPDNRYLLSSSQDQSLKTWDITRATPLRTLRFPQAYSGMNLTNTTGLTPSQRRHLHHLGAIEHPQ